MLHNVFCLYFKFKENNILSKDVTFNMISKNIQLFSFVNIPNILDVDFNLNLISFFDFKIC